MFKALLLQQWHGLSDPGLEASLEDRLSFRRFCGFALDAETPDHVTIHRFRETLRQRGLADRVFEEVNRQIDSLGLIVRQGTLIDASLVDAAVKRPKPPAENHRPNNRRPNSRQPNRQRRRARRSRYGPYNIRCRLPPSVERSSTCARQWRESRSHARF